MSKIFCRWRRGKLTEFGQGSSLPNRIAGRRTELETCTDLWLCRLPVQPVLWVGVIAVIRLNSDNGSNSRLSSSNFFYRLANQRKLTYALLKLICFDSLAVKAALKWFSKLHLICVSIWPPIASLCTQARIQKTWRWLATPFGLGFKQSWFASWQRLDLWFTQPKYVRCKG